jgi:hypothetical protein
MPAGGPQVLAEAHLFQNISSITAQAKQFPLKKPGGFHWDFFLLGCTTFVAGILGLPMPNGLVPQVCRSREQFSLQLEADGV